MKKETLEAAVVLGFLGTTLVFGGLTALLFNYVIGLFVEYPVTWSNWGKTWLAIICFNLIFNRVNRDK